MKKVILVALFMPYALFGQITYNFESHSLSGWVQGVEGHWKADTVSSLSGVCSLHHVFDNPDAGIDCIGYRLKDLHPELGTVSWSFLIKYGYEPSSLNNWAVYLASETDPAALETGASTKGFALGVNLTGSDDSLRLWKVDGSLITPVVSCKINWQTDVGTTNPVQISVERTVKGEWSVTVSSLSGTVIRKSSGTDAMLFGTVWFGLYYRYSSTRDRLLWLDNLTINGTFIADNEAPLVTNCQPAGKRLVEITLNEAPDASFSNPENFSLNSPGSKAISVTGETSTKYTIEFNEDFVNRSENMLIINNMCDQSGSCSGKLQIKFTPYWPLTGDVVITEIMADPTPQVSLPDQEYLEITNRTSFPVNLKNWKLQTGTQTSVFPEKILPPEGILILSSTSDTLLFRKYGSVAGLKNFPSLTDAGRLIYLTDSTGLLMHGVEYKQSWYNDDLKSFGGWSLEMIDTAFPFYYEGNWKASASRLGGTPGTLNSVSAINPDSEFSGIENVFPDDSQTVRLRFSEPVFNILDLSREIDINGSAISKLVKTDPLYREYSLSTGSVLPLSVAVQIELPADLTDFAGNQIVKNTLTFGLTEPAGAGDILFNEILFNPLPGDPDYIELYNNSEKIIDVSRLQISSIDDDTGSGSEAKPVSGSARCFLPGQYYAITTDLKKILSRSYSSDPEHIYEMESLPAMSDDKGHLILFNRELETIDELHYDSKMHYSLLSNSEGVSLEKSSPGSLSSDRASWHSASESSGWGTPGKKNSMYNELPSSSEELTMSSTRLTPDNDGNDDFLTVKLNLTGSGSVVSAAVFDETGNMVRKLAKNIYAGTETSLIWDGTADDGSLVRTGIYIVLINSYNDSGKTSKWKKVCTVLRK